MKLSSIDTDLFYKLSWSLAFYANQKYKVIKGLDKPSLKYQNLNKVMELYEQMFKNVKLIDSFITKNTFNFSHEELMIINSWKNCVKGDFLIVKHLKEYSVFMTMEEDQKMYGVIGLRDEIKNMVPPYLPIFVKTILLPFKSSIIHCGVIATPGIRTGSNLKKDINAEYQQAKKKFGIITSLEDPVKEEKHRKGKPE